MLKKGLQSKDEPLVTVLNEGKNTNPSFVSLEFPADATSEINGTLTISPSESNLAGRAYAIYMTGHVNVNATIQGPLSTTSAFNEV